MVIYDDNFNWFTKMCLRRMREAALAMIARGARGRRARRGVGHDARRRARGLPGRGRRLRRRRRRGDDAGRAAGRARWTRPRRAIGAGWCFAIAALVRRTGPRALLKELDALPFPAWDLVDIDRYRAIWRARHGYFSMNMVTTRGCPYHCNWCAKPI